MNLGKLVFAQITQHMPLTTFCRCVARYSGEHKVKTFSCLDQYLCMAFAQLTWRDSLRDIETCLRALGPKLYHAGFRGRVSRSTLAEAARTRQEERCDAHGGERRSRLGDHGRPGEAKHVTHARSIPLA